MHEKWDNVRSQGQQYQRVIAQGTCTVEVSSPGGGGGGKSQEHISFAAFTDLPKSQVWADIFF